MSDEDQSPRPRKGIGPQTVKLALSMSDDERYEGRSPEHLEEVAKAARTENPNFTSETFERRRSGAPPTMDVIVPVTLVRPKRSQWGAALVAAIMLIGTTLAVVRLLTHAWPWSGR